MLTIDWSPMARWKIQTDWVWETDSWLIFNFPDGARRIRVPNFQSREIDPVMPAKQNYLLKVAESLPFVDDLFCKMFTLRLSNRFIRSFCLCCIQCEWIVPPFILLSADNQLIATNQVVHWIWREIMRDQQHMRNTKSDWKQILPEIFLNKIFI